MQFGTMTRANGDTYRGEMVDKVPHGQGTANLASTGRVLRGKWANGLPNGFGTLFNKAGCIAFEGVFRAGKMHGVGKFELANGVIITSRWEHGEMTGPQVYPNGDSYVGDWGEAGPHGVGQMTFASGGDYSGDWVQGKQHGMGVRTYTSIIQHRGRWEDGKPCEADFFVQVQVKRGRYNS